MKRLLSGIVETFGDVVCHRNGHGASTSGLLRHLDPVRRRKAVLASETSSGRLPSNPADRSNRIPLFRRERCQSQ